MWFYLTVGYGDCACDKCGVFPEEAGTVVCGQCAEDGPGLLAAR